MQNEKERKKSTMRDVSYFFSFTNRFEHFYVHNVQLEDRKKSYSLILSQAEVQAKGLTNQWDPKLHSEVFNKR